MCGHSLRGLPVTGGNCPECGTAYTLESAQRLQPFPGALKVCCRLGWPVAGLVLAWLMAAPGDQALGLIALALGYLMIVAIVVNGYFQVRSMLKRSLPTRVRKQGPVAVLRSIGTVLCILILLIFVGLPLILGIGCLVLLSGEML